MSLHPHIIAPVPEETARVARAAFPKGHPYLTFRDVLGTIFQDEDFAPLVPAWGHPGLPPWRLALVTIMQLRENLADRQAAEAVRARIAWKYLLGLDLTDPGFDFSVLSEFRDRLLTGSAEELLLDKLLERCRTMGLLKARGQQRTDSTHVLAAIRVMNRLELVAETLRATLNELATVAPAWLQAMAPLAWYERYGKRIEDTRLPQGQASRDAGYALKAGHPLEGSCQEGKHPPYTPFCIFCRGMSHGISLPICRFARTRVFSDCDVTRSMATHQTPIRIKAHDGHLALWPGIRPLAPIVPQKTLGTLPCPIVTSTVHVALP